MSDGDQSKEVLDVKELMCDTNQPEAKALLKSSQDKIVSLLLGLPCVFLN